MAIVDVAVKPSPPPSPPLTRITVMVMAFVRFIIALILGFLRVVYLAAPALPYLGFATAWVISVGMAATIVARHAYRKGSAPSSFSRRSHKWLSSSPSASSLSSSRF
ncbi:hypothetical protein QYE76_040106 [Lolium multiflorum]|uniref:Uncharacterized protein n=1 Tax=Lolium multiflorum TaxID=4521 RepID=A0AAD8TC74_LOLMU|nr:hypothetical protein QYE76_040106 [Lolium multiflorum]